LVVTDGARAAAVALLGNYIAASLVGAAGGHGGALAGEAASSTPQAVLSPPHHRSPRIALPICPGRAIGGAGRPFCG
jgi:hypothetical protein